MTELRSQAPWSPDEVESLNGYQAAGMMHPFTCPNRGDGRHGYASGDLGALYATTDGWACWFCDYQQTWAHPWMADGTWRRMLAERDALFGQLRAAQAAADREPMGGPVVEDLQAYLDGLDRRRDEE